MLSWFALEEVARAVEGGQIEMEDEEEDEDEEEEEE
jgi:hypothetical protein